MSVHRSRGRTVMSVLTLLIWAVIAAALVKFAFFPSTTDAQESGLDPTADYGQMTVKAQTGTIENSMSLEGTIRSDTATVVRATGEGEIAEVYVTDGQTVAAGDPILVISKEVPGEDKVVTDKEGNQTVTPGTSSWKNTWINAPAAGTLTLNALKGQVFAIGDVLGSVQPPTFSVQAALTPDQMYRMQEVPSNATITIRNGPAPFECTGLKVLTPTAGAETAGAQGAGDTTGMGTTQTGSSTSILATCQVPTDQTVFPGLQVKMDVVAGKAEDVKTLPLTAVEGRFQTGYVYLPGDDPTKPDRLKVGLGLSDATSIEVTDGLGADQDVLEFVPGQEETAMQCNPMTGEGC